MPENFELTHPTSLIIQPWLAEATLLETLPDVRTNRLDMQNGWRWYRLPPFADGDHMVSLSLSFFHGRLGLVTVAVYEPLNGKRSWGDWSEEEQHETARRSGNWLSSRGYTPGNSYPWGDVWAGYDPKSASGNAVVRFNHLPAMK